MGSRLIRTLLTVVIYALIAIAILLAVRQFGIFFARVARQGWMHAYDSLTSRLVIDFGARAIKTPYGGVFDVDNAITVVLAIAAEWLLSGVRDRA